MPRRDRSDVSRLFDHLMSEGKVSMAFRLLTGDSKGGVLSLDSTVPSVADSLGNPVFQSVREVLAEKHPCCTQCSS